MPFHPSYRNIKGKEIDLHVLVYTRPNLRDDGMFTHMGYNQLENIFDIGRVDKKLKEMNIIYPERWTNILEQKALLERIPILYPNIEKVTITTHSVYIIQCTQAAQVGICDDASKYPEKNYKDIEQRFCPQQNPDTGLTVLHG
jgi:hypothetical protein